MADPRANSLAGKRVVVTRAAEQSQPLMQALREAGAEPLLLPLIAYAPADSYADLDDCLRNASQFDWLFITSQNALRALQERSTALGFSLGSVFAGVSVAAVGPATAEVMEAAGLKVTYVSEVHTGVGLAKSLAASLPGKRVFLPRSDRANPELVEILELNGAVVTPVVAYKTVTPDAATLAIKEKLLHGNVDAVLFFSPSAVCNLRELLGASRFRELSEQAIFAAIGPISQNELKAQGVERILVAEDTNVPSALAALDKFFTAAGQHHPAGAKLG